MIDLKNSIKTNVTNQKVLKIVKEDVLRIAGEKDKKISFKSLKSEIKVSDFFFSKAIKELKKENLIHTEQNFLELTKKGRERARDIIEEHLLIENYFEKTKPKREAHMAAHILEHYVLKQTLRNIRKLSTLKEEDISLLELKLNQGTMVSDIAFSDSGLFEKVISMGIFPGKSIKIIAKTPNAIVVKVDNKKFALDRNIAKGIKVLEYERN